MASTSKKQSPRSPAAQRKSEKTSKAKRHATPNDQIPVVGLGASEGGLKPLQTLEEVSLARDLFYKLFNVNPIPTALIGLESQTFLNVNVEFLNYFGLKPEQIIDHDTHVFNRSLGIEVMSREEWINQVARDGQVKNYETKILHPSGETRNILASIQFIELDSVDALIATFIDITDRVRAEQQIRELASALTSSEQAERHRLSQILHDDLQQRIFAVQMQLSFLKDAYEKGDLHAFAMDFPQLEEWLTDAIKVTRQLSVDLSPPILHGEGLIEAVLWLAAQMNEQYGLRVDIRANETPAEIDEKVRVLTFYAVRELLFNVVKHAQTSEVAVRFEHYDSRLLVIVKDHGIGFDSAEITGNPQKAHGLLVIRDRLKLLGCKMEINSQPGNGTEAIIEVPYAGPDL